MFVCVLLCDCVRVHTSPAYENTGSGEDWKEDGLRSYSIVCSKLKTPSESAVATQSGSVILGRRV